MNTATNLLPTVGTTLLTYTGEPYTRLGGTWYIDWISKKAHYIDFSPNMHYVVARRIKKDGTPGKMKHDFWVSMDYGMVHPIGHDYR